MRKGLSFWQTTHSVSIASSHISAVPWHPRRPPPRTRFLFAYGNSAFEMYEKAPGNIHISYPLLLRKPCPLPEADIAVVADDDVIQQPDSHLLSGVPHITGELPVGPAGRGISAGMVVYQHDG